MTLRVRLMLGLLALLAVCLAVAGTASALALRSHLIGQTDNQLRGAQNLISTRGVSTLTRLAPLFGGVGLQRAVAPTEFVVELRQPDGSALTLTGGTDQPAAGGRLLASVTDLDRRIAAGTPFTIEAADGRYRALVTALPGGVTDLVALPMRPVEDTIGRLLLVETIVAAAVLALGGGCAWLLLGRGLRPLRDITRTAAAIADGDLERRVPHGRSRTETDRLAAALNVMLTQIQTAFEGRRRSQERLRQFVDDASHELRTPLTSVRGYVDMLRQGIVPPSGTDDALRRVQDETRRMSTLVDDMLYLAHLDEARPLEHATVDLAAIIRDAVADASAVEPDRPLSVRVPPECPAVGDPDALRQVIGNLLTNVRVHTPPGTAAEVSLRTTGGEVLFEVRDEGPGVNAADLDRIFDRFYRSAAGRDRGRGGSGLGMSIVAAVATAHGGRAEVASAPGQGLAVRVTLPAP
ncbi:MULTISPECIES: cell wall metabolism sensor histidine kinase WalK [unclassified Pseudofrankia]|uniref:sensor histidine kinase n=1 Tax=unclassified Pseudofrankia TaxID=2994372 RepID=UPI0008D9C413|nr:MULTISPECIES: HAMP domain-containing sensor histidine kinase [unclassified Pseudofrankia]MDT3438944.1 HAMP domain-containing sensor histidine kinase [Pseudofrankia sp. BMG5.37]OHV56945.1 two-component sensor histidine kinase [Pseudofrankia sp. BMG5.36]